MVKTNEPGYVYILTNPSFREDWVKIGKSARPVDIRSKELDNTAVPLPFEIYATIQTVKYNDVEKHVHKTIILDVTKAYGRFVRGGCTDCQLSSWSDLRNRRAYKRGNYPKNWDSSIRGKKGCGTYTSVL